MARSRFRKWLAGLTAALLLFTAAPVFADEAQPADPGAGQTPQSDISVMDAVYSTAAVAPSYVRIKNRWQSNYLYEASDGKVLYGLTAPEDLSAQWQIEENADGTKRIKNVKTGDYISIENVTARRDALTASPASDNPALNWYVENSSNAGFVLIKSATVPSSANLVIHEEDQLGYAEASNDINVTFDSPQWQLEQVGMDPVRIINEDRAGQALYEAANPIPNERPNDIAAIGTIDPLDQKGQWYLEPGENGKVKLRNRATGNYIIQFAEGDFWRPIEMGPAAEDQSDEWNMVDSVNGNGDPVPGFVTFKSALNDTYLLNTQFNDDSVRSNSWPPNDTLANSHWKIVPAFNSAPKRIVNYSPDNVGVDYLYEDNGSVKHGALNAVSDASAYQWIVEDYDGNKRFRNLGTGHYITAGSLLQATAGTSDASKDDQWRFVESDQYDDYFSLQSVSNATNYLNNGADPAAAGSGAVDPNSDQAQWKLEDSLPEYIRIQNVWQSFVLYEDENGDLKYGNARSDRRDQWHVEVYNGRKLFINRATGHYLSTPGADGHLKLVEWPANATPTPDLIWSAKTFNDGSKIIRNVNDPLPAGDQARLINLQNLTKYAEYASINRNWGSPKWLFVGVPEERPTTVRIVNKATNQALYDEVSANDPSQGVVKYGDVPESDKSSIWFLEDAGSDAYRLKNIGTGQYIAMENVAGDVTLDDPPEPLETLALIYPSWGSAKWFLDSTQDDGYNALRSGWAGHYITVDNGAVVVSKSAKAKAADGSITGNAQYQLVPVSVTPELPSGPIRIQNSYNHQYLYEQNGIAKYGNVEESNGYSHWIIEQNGGTTRVKNRVTGHYLETTPDYAYIVATDEQADTNAAAWSIEATQGGGRWLIRSQNGTFNDEYINVQNNMGYAERGLYLTSYGSVQWDFAAAPDAFETPDMNGDRNEATSTPVQDDTNFVRISNGSLYLTEANGTVSLTADGGAASQWLAQDFNGRKLLKNRATGRLLAAGESGLAAVDAARKTEIAAQWTIGDSLGYKTIRSAASDTKPFVANAAGSLALDAAASRDASLWAFDPVVSDVKYEAEDAFQGRGAKTSASLPGYTGAGYVDGLNAAGAKVEFAVHAQAAGSYELSVHYWNAGGSDATLGLYVNGLRTQTLTLPSSTGWTDLTVGAELRAGINTVALQADGDQGGAAIDSLTVHNSVNKNYRGATVPYITYEAEQGDTNGTILGPSRTYMDVASEASGRQAVKLDQTGQYVSFKTARAANSIVLRFSIPDSANGTGTKATLGLYVNGEFRQKLQLDSNNAWEYGSYPWSNNPQDGSPHRFFDEMHALIGDVPAGATITLKKDGDSAADYYIVDFADLEQAADPYEKPAGFVSVTDYGAVANDGLDDTAAFKAAMADAKANGEGVWFPQGEFNLADGLIDLDRVTIRGAGMWHTQLTGAKFFGRGSDVQVYDLLIDGNINVRDDEAHTNAFEGAFGPGSVFQNVWIEHSKAGIWLTKPKDGNEITDGLHMVGLRIRDLMADGINFCVGTTDSMMEQSDVRYPGDDGIAMWSAEGRASINNTARFNNVSLPWLADNIVVFGGTDNKIQDNIATDTITKGAGIAVSTRFNPVSFAGTTIVERNTMIRTGSYSSDVGSDLGGLWIAANEKDLIGPIVIRNNVAIDSKLQGLSITGSYKVGSVLLQDNVLDGAGTKGVEAAPTVSGSVTVDNLIVRDARIADVANNAPGAFAFNEVNEGFASEPKPFSVQWSDGATGRFAMKQGDNVAIRVLNAAGSDVTSQATFASANAAVANVSSSGAVSGVGIGETQLQVAYAGATRVYTLRVAARGGSVIGGGGGGGGSAGSAAPSGTAADNDKKLKESKESAIVFAVDPSNASGEVPFTAGGLRDAAQANPNAVIVIQSGGASYLFPLAQVGKAIGSDADPAAELIFKVRPLDDAAAAQAKDKAQSQGLKLAGAPVEFGVALSQAGSVKTIDNFGSTYVVRTLTVDGELDPNTATALLYDPATGTFRYAPASFTASGGKTTVTIKSPSNGIFVVAVHSATFSDIQTHWAKTAIEKLASKLIAQGVTADTFAPNRSITRAEFAALLVRALGLRGQGQTNSFSDVPASSWYADVVGTAAEYGLVKGMSDGSFRPGDVITREQMAVMIANAYALVSGRVTAAPAANFSDSGDIHAWAADSVALAVQQGLMQGQRADAFVPLATATRAEAAAVLDRLLEKTQLMN